MLTKPTVGHEECSNKTRPEVPTQKLQGVLEQNAAGDANAQVVGSAWAKSGRRGLVVTTCAHMGAVVSINVYSN